MSLNWNCSNVKGFDTKEFSDPHFPDEDRLHPVTNALIWASMHVGLGEITEKNAEEFARRLKIVEEVTGSSINYSKIGEEGFEDYPITLEDVKRHIGLYTNVSRYTKREFNDHVIQMLENRTYREQLSAMERVKEHAQELWLHRASAEAQ